MAGPNQPSKWRILYPMNADEEVDNQRNRPNLDAAFVVRTTEALESLSKDFWKSLPEWVTEGHIIIPTFRIVKGLDAEQVNAALDGYRDRSQSCRWLFTLLVENRQCCSLAATIHLSSVFFELEDPGNLLVRKNRLGFLIASRRLHP